MQGHGDARPLSVPAEPAADFRTASITEPPRTPPADVPVVADGG
jgi:hypothetical protein